jgi:hypothetical protein
MPAEPGSGLHARRSGDASGRRPENSGRVRAAVGACLASKYHTADRGAGKTDCRRFGGTANSRSGNGKAITTKDTKEHEGRHGKICKIDMYRIIVVCKGVPAHVGATGARDITEEFIHRPWHQNGGMGLNSFCGLTTISTQMASFCLMSSPTRFLGASRMLSTAT